ncbi:MAG: DUF1330 domain-containing protein [Pseudomonadota bacterium]
MTGYLEVTPDNGMAFAQRRLEGPIVMLNLLAFKPRADYSGFPELAPPQPISGRAAFERYVAHTLPFLHASGGEMMYLGEGGHYLIGPEDSGWDMVMLIRQSSAADFLGFAENPAYLAGIGHRTAALEDSRLLPLQDVNLTP